MSANYLIRFVKKNGELVPMLIDRAQPRQLMIRNREDFSTEIMENAQFSATLIEIRGVTRAPTLLVLALDHRIATVRIQDFGNDFWIRPEQFLLMEADMKFGRAIRLVGPKGTGKTTFASLLADRLGVSFIKVDGTGIFKPKDLFGAETGSAGTLRWNPSDLSLFIEKNRLREAAIKGVICLDEFSRMGHSMAPFHALFDHSKQFSFTTCDGTIVIDRLDGFVFVLTDNPVGPGYVGNQELDTAMDDRVESYEFSYPPAEWEVPWLQSKTGIDAKAATHIVQIATEARHLATVGFWQKGGPSPRRTLCVAQDVSIGLDMDLSVSQRILSRYASGDANSERLQIEERLRAKGIVLRHLFSAQSQQSVKEMAA